MTHPMDTRLSSGMADAPYRTSMGPAPLLRCMLCGDVENQTSHCVRCGADAPEAGMRGSELAVGCPRCARPLAPLGFDGGTIGSDLVTVRREDFYRWLPTADELPKTANPSPGEGWRCSGPRAKPAR